MLFVIVILVIMGRGALSASAFGSPTAKKEVMFQSSPLEQMGRASGRGGMYAWTDAGETSVLGVSAARHGRDPRQITDAGHQARRSGCMRQRSSARLDERTGRGACGLESCRSCGAGRRVRNHCVTSRWHVTGQTLD
ncbi:hypothetical protein ACLOJK_025163 [Asimina triloba]